MPEIQTPVYSIKERDRRWNLMRSFASQQGLDAIIVYGEHEDAGAAPFTLDNWLTNDRPGSTVVMPVDGDPIELVPFLNFFVDHAEGLESGDAIWIPAQNMRAGRDVKALVRVLNELGLADGTVGVLGLAPTLLWHPEGLVPFRLWHEITAEFPKATFKPIGREFIPLLLKQSDEELAVIRHGAAIGEEIAKAMVEATKVGVGENEIYATGMALAIQKGTIVPWMHMNTGPNAVLWGPPRWAWRPQSPRVLRSGDLVASEIFVNFGMRQTQHQLTIMIGPMPEDVWRAAQVARESYDAGLEAIKPGVRFGDVAAAMRAPVEKVGGWTKGPQIHSLNPLDAICGFSPPNFLEGKGYPEVHGIDTLMADMLVEPGMTFAIEPSCGFEHRGVTIGGTVIVGESGAIELNPFTAQLHHVSE